MPRWGAESPCPLNRGSWLCPRCGHQDPCRLCGAGRGARHPACEYRLAGGALEVKLTAGRGPASIPQGPRKGRPGEREGRVAGPFLAWWEGRLRGGALPGRAFWLRPWMSSQEEGPGWTPRRERDGPWLLRAPEVFSKGLPSGSALAPWDHSQV